MKSQPIAVALLVAASALGAQLPDAGIPQLRKQGTATQLVVDGKPFLILGGELGNSTASDLERMRPMWAKLRARLDALPVPEAQVLPPRLKALAVASLVCWGAAITAGRLLAYTYSRLTQDLTG